MPAGTQRNLDCRDLQNGQRYQTRQHIDSHSHTHTYTPNTLHPSPQDNAKLLQDRAVAYINADSAIEGECICRATQYSQWPGESVESFSDDRVCFRDVHTEGRLHSIAAHVGVRHHQAGEEIYILHNENVIMVKCNI